MPQFNMNLPQPLLHALEKASAKDFKTATDLVREILTKAMLAEGHLTQEEIIAYKKANPDGRRKPKPEQPKSAQA